jgi:hypothetical protein
MHSAFLLLRSNHHLMSALSSLGSAYDDGFNDQTTTGRLVRLTLDPGGSDNITTVMVSPLANSEP